MSRRAAMTVLTALSAAACSKAIFLAANVPASFGPHRRHADLPYGDGPQHRLDVYTPDPLPRGAPLVVFWYGGRWTTGDKTDYRFVGAALAQLGYVVVVPNYRHYPANLTSG